MNKLNTVKLPLAAWLVSLSCGAVAQEMEEVIITSSLIDASSDALSNPCLLYTSPSPRDRSLSRMPSSA